jgi:hypothetical protein
MFCWWLCELCGIASGMWRYELIQMVGIEWHVFSELRGSDVFIEKDHTVIVGWFVVSMWKNSTGSVSPVKLLWLCPPVAASCCKQYCMLNR